MSMVGWPRAFRRIGSISVTVFLKASYSLLKSFNLARAGKISQKAVKSVDSREGREPTWKREMCVKRASDSRRLLSRLFLSTYHMLVWHRYTDVCWHGSSGRIGALSFGLWTLAGCSGTLFEVPERYVDDVTVRWIAIETASRLAVLVDTQRLLVKQLRPYVPETRLRRISREVEGFG
jgi:hypothetical protein